MAISKLSGNRLRVGGGVLPVVRKYGINTTPTGSEHNTNIIFPSIAVVLDVWINVRGIETTGSTTTMNVGSNGDASNDPNGYLASISVTTVGLLKGDITNTATRGDLLIDVDTNDTWAVDTTSGGDAITFTAGSSDWLEFRGDIYAMFVDLS